MSTSSLHATPSVMMTLHSLAPPNPLPSSSTPRQSPTRPSPSPSTVFGPPRPPEPIPISEWLRKTDEKDLALAAFAVNSMVVHWRSALASGQTSPAVLLFPNVGASGDPVQDQHDQRYGRRIFTGAQMFCSGKADPKFVTYELVLTREAVSLVPVIEQAARLLRTPDRFELWRRIGAAARVHGRPTVFAFVCQGLGPLFRLSASAVVQIGIPRTICNPSSPKKTASSTAFFPRRLIGSARQVKACEDRLQRVLAFDQPGRVLRPSERRAVIIDLQNTAMDINDHCTHEVVKNLTNRPSVLAAHAKSDPKSHPYQSNETKGDTALNMMTAEQQHQLHLKFHRETGEHVDPEIGALGDGIIMSNRTGRQIGRGGYIDKDEEDESKGGGDAPESAVGGQINNDIAKLEVVAERYGPLVARMGELTLRSLTGWSSTTPPPSTFSDDAEIPTAEFSGLLDVPLPPVLVRTVSACRRILGWDLPRQGRLPAPDPSHSSHAGSSASVVSGKAHEGAPSAAANATTASTPTTAPGVSRHQLLPAPVITSSVAPNKRVQPPTPDRKPTSRPSRGVWFARGKSRGLDRADSPASTSPSARHRWGKYNAEKSKPASSFSVPSSPFPSTPPTSGAGGESSQSGSTSPIRSLTERLGLVSPLQAPRPFINESESPVATGPLYRVVDDVDGDDGPYDSDEDGVDEYGNLLYDRPLASPSKKRTVSRLHREWIKLANHK